jgi:beta-lactam-binding protein with PASTA domain
VGSPRANVENALKRLGYTKFTYDMVDNDKPAGTVLAVNPSGVVPFDQPITLRISNGPPPTETQEPSAPPSTPSAPSPPTVTPTTKKP